MELKKTQVTTLEELKDFINSHENWELIVNNIIEDNNWVDDCGKPYGICHDAKRKLEFNSNMEAVIIITNDRERIGGQIKEIRKSKGMAQQKLADMAGKQKSTISKIESGKFNPSIDLLSDILIHLDSKLIITNN